MQTDRVVFLGTGDAFSAGGRFQAAYLVQDSEGSMLLDCGSATLTSMNRHGLTPGSIDTVLLSHFHGDHFAGLPFLFLHYTYAEPRREPLRIVGPPEVEERVMLLCRAMYPDSAAEKLPFELQFIEVRPGKELILNGRAIECFPVPHMDRSPSYGYRLRSKDWKIVYSGDTGWTEGLPAHTEGADLFICECSFFETRYAMHLDYPRIIENLERFGAKRIVLTHLGQEVLRRHQEIDLEMAHDGMVLSP
jgi:ribonuclease BN (tRNA processing enzyme)